MATNDQAHGPDDAGEASPRQHWLAVLALAPRAALAELAAFTDDAGLLALRAPEYGLVMLRGRIAVHGDRFNLGEATITRCVLRCAEAPATVGVGYVLGRDAPRARWVAALDALLQQPQHHAALMREVIEPLHAATQAQHAAEHARSQTSRVRFETLAAALEP